jgi:signal transduction histidine kinase
MEGSGDGEEPKDPQKGGCWGGDEPEPEPPAPEPPCRSVVDYDTPRELRRALLTMKKSSPKDDEEETEASAATPSTNMPMKSGDGGVSSIKTEKESSTMDERSNSTSVSVAQQQPQPQPEQQQQPLDWVLQNFDPQVTKVQSMQEELDRLLVLKSYLILDSQRDEAFELLTRMASRFFKTPISAISLIDLGRQWFVSTQGLGEGDAAVKQTPRNVAFCAHTIQVKENSQLMIVPDAKLDARFCDNPFVVGNVVRFYAGAPLLSPEGYKLGSFCVIDSEPRPEPGLTLTEQAQLRDLASLAVRLMVDRRSLLQRRRKRRSRKPRKRRSVTTAPSSAAASVAAAAGATGAEASQQHHEDEQSDYEDDYEDDDYDDDEEDPEQLIAHAANDLMTPLSGVQLSLGLLKDDEQVKEKLNHHQLELLHTAASCSDFTIRICRTAINSLRQQQQQHHHQQQLQHAPSNHHPIHQHRDPAAVLKRQHSANSLSSNCSSQSSPCDLMAASLSAAADAVQQQQQRQQHEQNQPPPPVLTTVLLDLLNGLAMVMKPIPKLTPIILTLEQQQSDDKPPRVIQCDDLKLFRSALNLLSHALKRTLIGAVHLRIYPTTTAADSNSNKNKRSSWKNGTRLMFGKSFFFHCFDRFSSSSKPKQNNSHFVIYRMHGHGSVSPKGRMESLV